MAKLIGHSLIYFVLINFLSGFTFSSSTQASIATLTSSSLSSSPSSPSSTSSSSSSSSPTSTVKIEAELVSSESKNTEDKNDLLKDLKDLGPDDLAKLIKAKKEKELDEFKSKITNIRGNREAFDSYRTAQQHQQVKGTPIVQQQEDDYQSSANSGDSAGEDDFDDGNDSSGLTSGNEKGGKGSKFGGLGSLLPFLPDPGSVMTMMVKPIDNSEQMICDCYNPGKTSTQQTQQTQQIQQQQQQQQQLQITQQQIWPPISSNRKVPIMPPMAPMAPIQPMQPPISLFPPSPFSFIGQHFAMQPMTTHKKKQLNPFSLLLMGLTGGKRKRSRPRPRPIYPSYPPYQRPSIASVLPGFEPIEPELMIPVQQVYSIKGNSGSSKGGGGGNGRKGRKRTKTHNNLPPPPSSIKGRKKGKGGKGGKGGGAGKWHWADDYKDLTQGFNE